MTATPNTRWGEVRILPENELAVTACRWVKAAAKGGGRPPFTILFLHGEPGTGKSFLVRTLARMAGEVAITSAADFSRADSDPALLSATVLIVEDVHRLPVVAVERLVTVLDDRSARRRMTVVTATRSPFELRTLPKRLTSRLGGGLTVAIRPPSVESRLAVVTAYAKGRHRHLRPSDLETLSHQSGASFRELLGAADALALERLRAKPDRPAGAKQVAAANPFRDRPGAGEHGDPFDALLDDVAAAYRLPPDDLLGPSQHRTVVTARQTFAYVATVVGQSRMSEVKKYLNRSPSSFGNVIHELKWKMRNDPGLHAIVSKLESDWRANLRKLVARLSTDESGPAREPDSRSLGGGTGTRASHGATGRRHPRDQFLARVSSP